MVASANPPATTILVGWSGCFQAHCLKIAALYFSTAIQLNQADVAGTDDRFYRTSDRAVASVKEVRGQEFTAGAKSCAEGASLEAQRGSGWVPENFFTFPR